MPGLLDILGGNFGTDDPRQAAYLALASGLMSGRGNFNQVAGNALMDAQKSYQGANQLKQRSEMNQLEMDDIRRKARQAEEQQKRLDEQRALDEHFRSLIPNPQQAALAGGGGPTVENAGKISPVDPIKQIMFEALRNKQISAIDYLKSQQKDDTPVVLPNGSVLSTKSGKILATNEKEFKPTAPPPGFTVGPDGKLSADPEWLKVQLQLRAASRPPPAPNAVEDTTPDAIDAAAARYNVDGTLPPLGIGKSGTAIRAKVLNRAAELAKLAGNAPTDQRVHHLDAKAQASALMDLSKREANVGAFERNFSRNADLALEYSGKVDRAGMPIVNKWIQAGKRAVVGDPELSAFDLSIKTAVNEYAKILSGSMGNTVLAESEIKKVESLLNAAQNQAQIKEVVSLMKRETANRMKGFTEEKERIRKDMVHSTAPAPSSDKVVDFGSLK